MFQIIPSTTNRNIIKTIPDLKNLVQYISSKEGREEIPDLLKARDLGKNHSSYRYIKTQKLPCTAINFNYKNNYIKGENIDTSTGYLYIDIDNIADIQFNTTYICAYWRSLSNNGYTVIVKVDGLTKENFKPATLEIAKSLELPYDSAAISIDRLTVLSYDENAYFNDNTEIINVNDVLNISINGNPPAITVPQKQDVKIDDEKVSHFICNKYLLSGCNLNGTKLRFDNLQELKENIDISFDENGVCDLKQNKLPFVKTFFPTKVKEGNRENFLKSFIYNLRGLNPNIDKENFEKYIHYINKNKMQIPLPYNEVKSCIEKVYEKQNKIELKSNASKRFFFDETKPMAKSEKQSFVGKYVSKDKVVKSKAKIRDALENWNFEELGKMSIRNIAKKSELSKSTVEKYLKAIKEDLGFT
jgi:hypothetical protein